MDPSIDDSKMLSYNNTEGRRAGDYSAQKCPQNSLANEASTIWTWRYERYGRYFSLKSPNSFYNEVT